MGTYRGVEGWLQYRAQAPWEPQRVRGTRPSGWTLHPPCGFTPRSSGSSVHQRSQEDVLLPEGSSQGLPLTELGHVPEGGWPLLYLTWLTVWGPWWAQPQLNRVY